MHALRRGMSLPGVSRPEICRPDRHAVVRIVSAAIRCRDSPRPAPHGTARVKLRHYRRLRGGRAMPDRDGEELEPLDIPAEFESFKAGVTMGEAQRALLVRAGFIAALAKDPRVMRRLAGWLGRLR